MARQQKRTAAKKTVQKTKRGALCKSGLHKLNAANRYDHPSKGIMCRECIRDYMRDYMRVRREDARVEAARASRRRAR